MKERGRQGEKEGGTEREREKERSFTWSLMVIREMGVCVFEFAINPGVLATEA